MFAITLETHKCYKQLMQTTKQRVRCIHRLDPSHLLLLCVQVVHVQVLCVQSFKNHISSTIA